MSPSEHTSVPPLRRRRYPEIAAGGYSRVDGKISMFLRIDALLEEMDGHLTVLDFGAGRGRGVEDGSPLHRRLQDLRRPNRTVIGVDVDPVVLENPLVDDAHVIGPDGRIPLPDGSVDLVLSEFVLEHLDDPEASARELERVMKPGAWLCACTPNRWGYLAIAARLVPNRLHVAVLARLQPHKKAEDTFPTRYRLNTRAAFRRHFPTERFEVIAYTHEAEPDLYSGGRAIIERLVAMSRFLPSALQSLWLVYIRKR